MLAKQYDAMAAGRYIRRASSSPATRRSAGSTSSRWAASIPSYGERRTSSWPTGWRPRVSPSCTNLTRSACTMRSGGCRSWLDAAYAYGRHDVVFGRDRGKPEVLSRVAEEYGRRHLLTRLFTRICASRPGVGSASTAVLRRLAEGCRPDPPHRDRVEDPQRHPQHDVLPRGGRSARRSRPAEPAARARQHGESGLTMRPALHRRAGSGDGRPSLLAREERPRDLRLPVEELVGQLDAHHHGVVGVADLVAPGAESTPRVDAECISHGWIAASARHGRRWGRGRSRHCRSWRLTILVAACSGVSSSHAHHPGDCAIDDRLWVLHLVRRRGHLGEQREVTGPGGVICGE